MTCCHLAAVTLGLLLLLGEKETKCNEMSEFYDVDVSCLVNNCPEITLKDVEAQVIGYSSAVNLVAL